MKLKHLFSLLLCLLPLAGAGQVHLGLLPEVPSVTSTDRVLIVAPGGNSPGRLISYPALFANSNLYFGSFAGNGVSVTNVPASSITSAPWLSSVSNNWVGSFAGNGALVTNVPASSITSAPWLSSTSNNWIGSFTGDGSGATNVVAKSLNASGVTFASSGSTWTSSVPLSVTTAGGTNRAVDWSSQTNAYDDIVFPMTSLNPPGAEAPATFSHTSGQSGDQMALVFSVNNIFHVAVQTPHTWVAGTQIYPHLHIEPQTAGAITSVWRVAYSIADIGSAFPADTVETNQMIIAASQQWFSKLVNMPTNGISMTGKVGPSTMVRMKYTLLSTSSDLHVLSFDIHIRTGGSPQPFNP